MENKLQELTQKIYQEGITKANEEASSILEKARKEADELLKNAQKEAANILDNAKFDADVLKNNTYSELTMSVKLSINAFKQELNSILAEKSVAPVKLAVNDSEFIQKIIEIVVKNWKSENPSIDLTILLPESNQKELESFFVSKAKENLDSGLTLKFSDQIKAGFKIGPKDGGYIISFTEEDFENFFKTYARPKLREFLFGGK